MQHGVAVCKPGCDWRDTRLEIPFRAVLLAGPPELEEHSTVNSCIFRDYSFEDFVALRFPTTRFNRTA
jgi:hypothetical protein